MNGEFDLYGVFLPRLLVCGIAALFLMRFITRLMARWRLYRLLSGLPVTCYGVATALVRSPAGFDPAPGSVSANEATTSPAAIAASHRVFCSSVPKPTRTWPAMPLLVPNIERTASDV